ncbi:glycosyltransferase family 2 protein [Candidatus Woesebacteria bacterium]|nr:glycosyltransferase family 2 protein [Candidatus Woesebacteria bacterium]
MKDLSVIVISYNTCKLTKKTLERLITALKKEKLDWEVIVVDNASIDGSVQMLDMLAKDHPEIIILKNTANLGFGAANNIGIKKAQGEYVLLLNSDVEVADTDFVSLISYLKKNESVGGLTVKVNLRNGKIDPASHRGFPTMWHSFSYFFGLERLTKNIPVLNTLFGGYHLTWEDLSKRHEIDSPTAAFFLLPRQVLKEVGGFDEKFFMYGEDLDLSYRIKEKGYKIMYYPKFIVIHLKHQSGLKTFDPGTKRATKDHFYDAMKIFYRKHYAPKKPAIVNWGMYKAIDLVCYIKTSVVHGN